MFARCQTFAVSEVGSGSIRDLEVRQQQTQPFPPFMLRDARTKSKDFAGEVLTKL